MAGSRDTGLPGFTLVGSISGHFGVKGWVRVHSYTRPREEILQFAHWTLLPGEDRRLSGSPRRHESRTESRGPWRVLESRRQKNGLVVRLEGIASREDAEPLIGLRVAVPDNEMPALPEGEYYWAELVGLQVVNLEGERLGRVDHLVETGANDVLVVVDESGSEIQERLIPWGAAIVDRVDLENGELRVNWGRDY